MPRRDPRSRVRSAPDASCPCGLPATYGDCCGRLHRGEASATTAEALMRSRFSAFGVGDAGYLQRTWHPSTRPPVVELDDSVRWTRLEVLETTGGSSFHTEGAVRFRAHYVERGEPGHLEEHSRFARHAGNWVYVGAL
ncbi:YchJ family metal-binding protein [Streptosporangium sp. NPDC023825]|uniref:YchJ family protein n=1 Tax=Streptosporangium sp. NPDC023825 TaxID=3154909 RepID=UPI00341DC29B